MGWGGEGGGARTIIEGVASTGRVVDARVVTTTHFYTSRVWWPLVGDNGTSLILAGTRGGGEV